MAKTHLLASRGVAQYVIACEPNAPAAVAYAAQELSRYLSQITSAVWPVVAPSRIDAHKPIIVGFNPLTSVFDTPRDETLGKEDYIIRSVDAAIIIAGGGERATLYGVYAFLETLGCRFLAGDETVIPDIRELETPPLNIREKPAFEYRFGYYRPCLEPSLSVKMRFNGTDAGAIYGGNEEFIRGASHSFFALVPPERYFEEHPEYFSMINGVRVKNKQLCLTNPEVYEIIRDSLRQRLGKNPRDSILSVSINDGNGACECPECKRLDDAEESNAASLVTLLNRLAEELEKDFPDVVIGTLAYLHTRKPPKTLKPRRNVIIWLCSIECCFSHPIDKCADVYGPRMGEQSFPGDLKGWTALTDNVFIWDYVNNFAHYVQPHPNFQVLAHNIHLFRDCGVRGVFEQGHTNGTNGSPCLNELRYYLISKLLWNPDCDIEAAKNDFLNGYYGPAAAQIERFIGVFEERIEKGNIHMGISSPPDSDYLDPATLDRAELALFEAKSIVPEDGKYARRIEKLFLLIEYPRLARRVQDGVASSDEINGFFNEMYRLGYDHVEEGMDNEKRKRYILEMGRMTNLIKGHFRDKAMEKNVT